MKRLALLIGSPSKPSESNFLAGVKTDIENMYHFLRSSIGGSWQVDEIKTFYPNPNFSQVEPYLQACQNVDIAFVYFSGHGYTDKFNKGRVIFQEYDHPFVIDDLSNRANKQITIIDACRSYPEYSNFTGSVLEGIEFPNPNPEKARQLYNNYLSKIQNSRVLLHATEKGQNSSDFGRDYGGLFSTSLLETAKLATYSGNKPIFNIYEIFEKAKIETNKLQSKQMPMIYTTNNKDFALNLPFAIKSNSNISRIDSQKIKQKDNSLAEDILTGVGIAVVGGLIIGSLFSGKK